MSAPLEHRVAIVTGGTGALGQAVTLRLIAEGATVCVTYRADKERERLLVDAEKSADRLLLERVDVTDLAAMTHLADTVMKRYRRIDILVTLVGGFAGGTLLETDRATWDRMIDTNLTSTFVATRAVVPHMVAARHGRVMTIGSRAVLPPAGGFIAYTAAKTAVIGFTRALAQEMRGHGVTVNAILPSTMDTPANRAAMPGIDRKGWVPVESVAEAIAFLARDSTAHVTGTLLTI